MIPLVVDARRDGKTCFTKTISGDRLYINMSRLLGGRPIHGYTKLPVMFAHHRRKNSSNGDVYYMYSEATYVFEGLIDGVRRIMFTPFPQKDWATSNS